MMNPKPKSMKRVWFDSGWNKEDDGVVGLDGGGELDGGDEQK